MAGRFDFTNRVLGRQRRGPPARPDFIVRTARRRHVRHRRQGARCAFPDAAGRRRGGPGAAPPALRTAASMKTHVRQLSAKAYQDQFKPSPDFVAMFVPGDGFLAAALDHEPDLMTEAMASRVLHRHADHPVRPVQGRGLRLARRGAGAQRRRGREAGQGALQAPVGHGRPRRSASAGRWSRPSASTTSSSARWRARSWSRPAASRTCRSTTRARTCPNCPPSTGAPRHQPPRAGRRQGRQA